MTAVKEGLQLYKDRYGDGSNGGAILWGEEVLGSTYWSKQKEIIESVFSHPRSKTAVKACHSSSKTYTAADVVLMFLCLLYPSKVVTTAPTFHQVRNLLWSEIRARYNKRLAHEMVGVDCLQTRIEIDPDWYAVGFSTDEAVNFTGIHQQHVLVVFDEAPGVRTAIVEAAETLGAGGDTRYLWIGQPIEAAGPFYNAFRSNLWNKISIPYTSTPNFTGEDVPQKVKDVVIQQAWVEERRDEWGEDSPLFTSRCRADFPESDQRSVISLKLCEEAVNREVLSEGEIDMGIDCGGGGDLTVYTKKRGNVVTDIITESTPDVMQIPYAAVAYHKKDKYRYINVDKGGLGHGVVNRMEELGLPVVGIQFGGDANDKDQYANKRTELWFNLKKWLEYGKIPNDSKLIRDLTATRVLDKLTPRGQVQLEPKSETKKLLGHSPDRGDSLALAVDQTSGARGPGVYFL